MAEAADVLWALLDPAWIDGLVEGRGWSVERWADWAAGVMARMLLP